MILSDGGEPTDDSESIDNRGQRDDESESAKVEFHRIGSEIELQE